MKMYPLAVICISMMAACVQPPPRPASHRQHDALRLIDQGVIGLRTGDLERAAASFTLAYDLAPMAQALDGLGAVAFLSGDLETAERHFIGAYQLDSSYSEALANLALLYESQWHISEAEALYKRALKEKPDNFRARNNFAAYLYDRSYGRAPNRGAAHRELLKAEAVSQQPLIRYNLDKTGR